MSCLYLIPLSPLLAKELVRRAGISEELGIGEVFSTQLALIFSKSKSSSTTIPLAFISSMAF
jgi:hypothetical protein